MFGLMKAKVHIRWMISKDIERMAAIAREEFVHFEVDDIESLHAEKDVVGLVAEIHEQVVAFVFYKLAKKYLSIRLVAVTEAARRKGIGTSLLRDVASRMKKGRETVIATVPERSLVSHLFLRACGFKYVHTLRGVLEGEDMYVFMYKNDPWFNRIGRYVE